MTKQTTSNTSFSKLVIVGPGLLGGSIGLGLKAAGCQTQVVGVSQRQSTIDAALAIGSIDQGTLNLAEAVVGADIILLAMPLGEFASVLGKLAEHLEGKEVITDVGSTKVQVVTDARAALTADQMTRFVGSHPMAGREKQGATAAVADLLAGKPCIMTPEADTDAQALATVRAIWTQLGMNVIQMTAQEHDQDSAVISHLPHLACVMAARTAMVLDGMDMASTGFRDATRLASSNPTIRADILKYNRDAILRAMDTFEAQWAAMRKKIEAGNRDSLYDDLVQTKAFRDAWMTKQSQKENKEK